MTKAELVETLKNESGLSRNRAKDVVDLFFDEIFNTLVSGNRIEIRGFCSIYVKDYREYMGRNPKTGEPTLVPRKKLPFFKCGKQLKEIVDIG